VAGHSSGCGRSCTIISWRIIGRVRTGIFQSYLLMLPRQPMPATANVESYDHSLRY